MSLKTKFRDVLIIVTIILISTIGYFMFQSAYKDTKRDYAVVYYLGEEIVIVNFRDEKLTVVKNQHDANEYPKINKETQTIVLLGAYQGNDRYEVTIKYNFENRSMQITDETSPRKVCSGLGVQTSFPIECEPNRIRILFKYFDEDDDYDGEI